MQNFASRLRIFICQLKTAAGPVVLQDLPIRNCLPAAAAANLNTNCLQFLLFGRLGWSTSTAPAAAADKRQSQLQGVAFKLHIEL